MRASTAWIALALLTGCGGGLAVVGGDAPEAVEARDARSPDAPDAPSADASTPMDVVDVVAPQDVLTTDTLTEARDVIGRVDSVAADAVTLDADPLCPTRCLDGEQCCGGRCVPVACARGMGACATRGPVRCERGEPICEAVAGAAGTEVCNNVDDDCDGMTDEDLRQPCFMGPGGANVGICRAGAQACVNGAWGACVGMVAPATETCDGRDENCNGAIDDGVADVPCFTFTQGMRNVGRCRDGLRRCAGGVLSACVGELGPLPEICNAFDDDCDGAPDDAVDLSLCPGRPNANPSACVSGACRYTCAAGFGDCDGNLDNGCETNTRTALQHCGGCGRACATGQFCDSGTCRANCSTGSVCGGLCVDTSSNVQHCGGCGMQCPAPPGGFAQCVAGLCGVACGTGLTFCNGACVNLAMDANHCGSCNNACRSTQVCTSQTGSPSCVCTNGQIDCAGQCVSAQSDAFNCGACGVRCPGGSSCVSGQCRCAGSGLSPCGGSCAGLGQGCTSGAGACLRSGQYTCSADTLVCNAIAGAPQTETCNNVDDDCDGVVDDSNAASSCPTLPYQTASCVAGTCSASCFPGRGDCNGVISDGCETSLLDAQNHCGRCGVQCGTGQRCVMGACQFVSTADAGGDAVVDASTDSLDAGDAPDAAFDAGSTALDAGGFGG